MPAPSPVELANVREALAPLVADLRQELAEAIRRNPRVAIAAGVAFGFILSRVLSR
jgi:hypothetical protein